MRKFVIVVVTLLIVAAGVGAAWWVARWFANREPAEMDVSAMQGVIVTAPALPLPAFQLVDGNNQAFTNERLKGHWTLVYFGYTHCPDICPTTLQTLAGVRAKLSEAQRAQTQLVFISLDPRRDLPAELKLYAAHFDPTMVAATAPKPFLDVLTEKLGVIYEFVGDVEKNDYMLNHYGAVFVIDPQARLRAYILPPHQVPRVLEAYTKVLDYYGAKQ